jgi:hypothetical protein
MQYSDQGASYTTDDLIRLARLESFGQFSPMLGRVFVKLKLYEQENRQLKELVSQLQSVDNQRNDSLGNPIEKLL